MILKLSFRNIYNHKKQSLITVLFMVVLSLIFFFGTSLLHSINSELENFYRDNVTGDYVILNNTVQDISLFGAVSPAIGEFIDIPVLDNWEILEKSILDYAHLQVTKQITGSGVISISGKNYPTMFFGVDYNNYFTFFSGISLIDGNFLKEGEKGILISSLQRKDYEKELNRKIEVGDRVQISLYKNNSFKIQELEIRGFFEYPDGSTQLERLVFIDPESARSLTSIFQASEEVIVSEEQTDLLGDDWESLLEEDFNSESENSGSVFDSLLSDVPEPEGMSVNKLFGGWNFIIIKGDITRLTLEKLVSDIGEYKVLNWREASGQTSLIGLLLIYFFTGGFVLASFAAGVGIVNVMTISILNRTGEIGTIRALGGHRALVVKLILTEVLLLSLIGSLAGIATGYGLITLINNSQIEIDKELLISLFGGKTIKIGITHISFINTILFSTLFGLISSLVPLANALKISPLDAIERVS